MTPRRGAGTAAQDVLVAHEFPVVLAKRAGSGVVAGVRRVGAARPFPNVAEHLYQVSMLLWFFRRDIRLCQGSSKSRHRMQEFAFDEIAFNWTTQRSAFPFELGRETRTGPVSVGVSFEIANVCDRLGLIDGAKTGKCEIPPRAVAFCPV